MDTEKPKTLEEFLTGINKEDDSMMIAVKRGDKVRIWFEGTPKECVRLKIMLLPLVVEGDEKQPV